MADLVALKASIFERLRKHIEPEITKIASFKIPHQAKAKLVNAHISGSVEQISDEIDKIKDVAERQASLITLQYCYSVLYLEYRHKVWPYEYMALSRRVGELWQRFCAAAWDCPSRANVSRMEPPSFKTIMSEFKAKSEVTLEKYKDELQEIGLGIDLLVELIGDINMAEDEVFTLDGKPVIVDFKSGFGSNEKGNTLRLIGVAKAYKLWNPETELYLLVRQEQNNNYLKHLEATKLWTVLCGAEAYAKIDEFTGSNMKLVRESVVNFEGDLSRECWAELSSQLSDLTGYLRW